MPTLVHELVIQSCVSFCGSIRPAVEQGQRVGVKRHIGLKVRTGLIEVLTDLMEVLTCLKVLTKDLLGLQGLIQPVDVVEAGEGVCSLANVKVKLIVVRTWQAVGR